MANSVDRLALQTSRHTIIEEIDAAMRSRGSDVQIAHGLGGTQDKPKLVLLIQNPDSKHEQVCRESIDAIIKANPDHILASIEITIRATGVITAR